MTNRESQSHFPNKKPHAYELHENRQKLLQELKDVKSKGLLSEKSINYLEETASISFLHDKLRFFSTHNIFKLHLN